MDVLSGRKGLELGGRLNSRIIVLNSVILWGSLNSVAIESMKENLC